MKGANSLGTVGVWPRRSPRRSKIPADAREAPAYPIDEPRELLELLDRLESGRGGASC